MDITSFYPACRTSYLSSSPEAESHYEQDGDDEGWASEQHLWNFMSSTRLVKALLLQPRMNLGKMIC